MSCTSPFTVANKILAAPAPSSFCVPAAICANRRSSFSFSINGVRMATLFFITLALLTTCGKNIFPLPKRSPTTFIPSINGPSITSKGFGYFCLASSVSVSIKSVIPLTSEWVNLSSTVPSRQAAFLTSPFSLAFTVSAKFNNLSVASSRRFKITSSHNSFNCGSIWS